MRAYSDWMVRGLGLQMATHFALPVPPADLVVTFMARRYRFRVISEQLFDLNVERFRGGLVFKAYGVLYHSTLGL